MDDAKAQAHARVITLIQAATTTIIAVLAGLRRIAPAVIEGTEAPEAVRPAVEAMVGQFTMLARAGCALSSRRMVAFLFEISPTRGA